MMPGFLAAFARSRNGAVAIEYALIGMLIAMVVIGSVTLLGQNLLPLYESVAEGFAGGD